MYSSFLLYGTLNESRKFFVDIDSLDFFACTADNLDLEFGDMEIKIWV